MYIGDLASPLSPNRIFQSPRGASNELQQLYALRRWRLVAILAGGWLWSCSADQNFPAAFSACTGVRCVLIPGRAHSGSWLTLLRASGACSPEQ